jgi:hypothetical protein
MRIPSPSARGLPSLTMRIAICLSLRVLRGNWTGRDSRKNLNSTARKHCGNFSLASRIHDKYGACHKKMPNKHADEGPGRETGLLQCGTKRQVEGTKKQVRPVSFTTPERKNRRGGRARLNGDSTWASNATPFDTTG